MSFLARITHGFVCPPGSGQVANVIVNPTRNIEAELALESQLEATVANARVLEAELSRTQMSALLASSGEIQAELSLEGAMQAELTSQVIQAEMKRESVMVAGSAVNACDGFIEPERPPLYGDRLVYWNTAAWPGTSENTRDDTVLANAPEDRSTKKLEALRVYTVGDIAPGTFVPTDPIMGVPVWTFDQTNGTTIEGFQNSIGENHGNPPVEVGDTGPRWTWCVVVRHEGTAAGGHRPFTFNTPHFQFYDNGNPAPGLVRWRPVYSGADVVVRRPENNCYVALMTSFGDGTTQAWVNGVWGERVAGFPQSLGVSYWMGHYTTQASSWQGAVHAVYAWDRVVDPDDDGLADYIKRQVPGVFDFTQQTFVEPPGTAVHVWSGDRETANYSDGDPVDFLENFGTSTAAPSNTGTARPTFVENAVGGLPAIRFTATQSLSTVVSAFAGYGSTAMTAFLARRQSTTGVGIVDRSIGGTRMVLYERLANKWTHFTTQNYDTDAPALANQWDVVVAYWAASGAYIRVNGLQYATPGPVDPSGATSRSFNVFSPDELEIAEWVEWDGGLAALPDPADVEAYFAAKYGL